MADEPRIEVHGYEQLADGSRDLFEKIGERAGREFETVAEQAGSAARASVPRLTGALAASVVAEREGDAVIVGMGDDDTPYAGWIEFGGTRLGRGGGVAERPYLPQGRYLYPAAVNAEPVLVAAGEEAADDEIGRFRWPKPSR